MMAASEKARLWRSGSLAYGDATRRLIQPSGLHHRAARDRL